MLDWGLCLPPVTAMALHLSSVHPDVLPELQALWQRQMAPLPVDDLAHGLLDAAREHGRHALMAWRDGHVVGAAGWVTFGIAVDGCGYGSPLVAADGETARVLIDAVLAALAAAGAARARIAACAGEVAKHEALRAGGFGALFEFVHFVLPLPMAAGVALPPALHCVPAGHIDWSRLRACYAETFAGVANSPVPDAAVLREEWSVADWQASRVLADAAGEYQAFVVVCGDGVDAVGVRSGWRGHHVAQGLYAQAAAVLACRGVAEMAALVASDNAPSLRFHHALGCHEAAPRRTVYEIALADGRGRTYSPYTS